VRTTGGSIELAPSAWTLIPFC